MEIRILVVEIECDGKIIDAFDKETGSSDGLRPEQVDLNYVHALNEPHLHEIRVVLNLWWESLEKIFVALTSQSAGIASVADNSEYFFSLITPFSLIFGQRSGPFSTDSRIILPYCLFIMYSSIRSYMSFSNIGGRLSAPERIAL
nr:hypothetical protein [Tanacetum cinerariifolium]